MAAPSTTSSLVFALAALIPLTASAGIEPAPPAIFGGTLAETCEFPNVVSVITPPYECTGVLIHPRVVLYGGICGASAETMVSYGEQDYTDTQLLPIESCAVNPDWVYGEEEVDWAYCVLQEEVDLPIAPPLWGCDFGQLVNEAEVMLVGHDSIEPTGVADEKNYRTTTIKGITPGNNLALVGGGGDASFCQGGGVGLIQLEDGSWRTWGTGYTVAGGECGGSNAVTLLLQSVPHIEAETGIDLTPCHNIDGTWNPTQACTDFMTGDPTAVEGSWSNMCAANPRSDAGQSCGAPFDPGAGSEDSGGESDGETGDEGDETGTSGASETSGGSDDEAGSSSRGCSIDDDGAPLWAIALVLLAGSRRRLSWRGRRPMVRG